MDKNVSRLIKTMENWSLTKNSTLPNGQFGHVCKINTSSISMSSDDLDIEFTIPFDDDTEANEAEIVVYNLSKNTISNLKYNDHITITAGYKNDSGVVFSGYISKVSTVRDGVDKKTTINALDDMDLKEHAIKSITFKANTKASYILKQLISFVKLPLAVFKIRRDYVYKDETTVDGNLMENIKNYAQVCGISVYINQSKIYARYIKDGDNINFTINAGTGMIDSPEEFEEDVKAEDYDDIVKGYKVKMLLQHRMTTAAIINLDSNVVKGKFRVRSGRHTFNNTDAITEIEVI